MSPVQEEVEAALALLPGCASDAGNDVDAALALLESGSVGPAPDSGEEILLHVEAMLAALSRHRKELIQRG